MLQNYLRISDIFSIFVLENQIHPNGIVAAYHHTKT